MLPLIPVTDTIFLPTYILVISMAYSMGLLWAINRTKAQEMSVGVALDISLAIMIGGFLGARLFHIAYEDPIYYWNNPLQTLFIWRGGFVFFGGALGALLASLWVLKRKDERFGPWADLFAPVFAFGYAVGRIGCFANGCCFGDTCNLPWAIHLPREGAPMAEGLARHPTQLYATGWEVLVCVVLLIFEQTEWRKRKLGGLLKEPGSIFFLWVALHSVGRIGMEYFRVDFRGALPLGFSISTWLSFCFLAVAVFLLYRGSRQKI